MSKGIKLSEGKLHYEIDFDIITLLAERIQLSKNKYEPYNWQKDMDVEHIKQALFRHTLEIMKGNYEDDGQEFGHLGAVLSNIMFLNYQLKNKKKD